MPTIDELMEAEQGKERARQATRRRYEYEKARLGSREGEWWADPRVLKVPVGTLHRKALKNMGRIWEQEPRKRKHPTRVAGWRPRE